MKKLTNRTRQAMTINLAHDVVCGEKCLCTPGVHRAMELNPETGDTGIREIDRLICASVHIMPKESSDALPDSVVNLPEVRAGLVARPPRVAVTDVPDQVAQ